MTCGIADTSCWLGYVMRLLMCREVGGGKVGNGGGGGGDPITANSVNSVCCF